MRNIFFIHHFNDYSGSPRVLSDAIQSLNDLDDTKLILFTSHHAGFLSGLPVTTKCFPYARSSNKILQLFYYLFSQVYLFFQLAFSLIVARYAREKNIVVINTMLPFGGALAAKLFGADEVVYYVHESSVRPRALKLFLRFMIELTATKVIFVSHYLGNEERFSSPEQHIVYNGLRSDFSITEEIDYQAKFSSRKLVFAGSLKEYKGVFKLDELALLLPDFEIIAALNCEMAEFNQFIQQVANRGNVTYLCRPANIQSLYNQAFCVLNLSIPGQWVETFALSLLEGMSYGCPVIAPTVGGQTEYIDEQVGALIDSTDMVGIASQLRAWGASYDLWVHLAKCAEQRATKFSATAYRETFSSFMLKHIFQDN